MARRPLTHDFGLNKSTNFQTGQDGFRSLNEAWNSDKRLTICETTLNARGELSNLRLRSPLANPSSCSHRMKRAVMQLSRRQLIKATLLGGAASALGSPLAGTAAAARGDSMPWPPASHDLVDIGGGVKLPRRQADDYLSIATHDRVSPEIADQITYSWRTSSTVYLTFDDYGTRARTTAILDVLKRKNVRARFYYNGQWFRDNPDIYQRMLADGHRIGNHTTPAHPDLMKLSDYDIRRQIRAGAQAPSGRKLLRPPYGSGAYSKRLYDIAVSENHYPVFWTFDSRDWDGSTTATILRRLQYGDAYTPPIRARGIALFHSHGRYTLEALPQVIDKIRAMGLSLVRLY